jgi:2,5-diketo-D-gluconate reductase A
VLAGDEFTDAVEADIRQARAYGATGVPFFVDGRYGISGAQPTEVFDQALRQADADAGRLVTVAAATDEACGPDGRDLIGNSPTPPRVGTNMTVPHISLNDGTSIPQLGFGVFQVRPDKTVDVVRRALEVGYRHLDTAQMYRNEAGVGQALEESGLDRDDVYVTTKLDNGCHRPDDAKRSLEESLEKLRLDQVDLFLIHWPLPTRYDGDFVSTWETLVELRDSGRTRSIGVSNFQPDHLDRIVKETGVVPSVNQIEVHPFFPNETARAANARHGVATEAWSPIAKGHVVGHPVIETVAARVGRTASQVTLRWHLQRGDIVFPKSTRVERMHENLALFDFELSEEDMVALSGLDRGEPGRTGPNPDTFDWVPR